MTVEEALTIVEKLLEQHCLSNLQELVFRQCWEGKTYPEIAVQADYDTNYIRNVGWQLWQLLSETTGKKVSKTNIRSVLKREKLKTTPVVATPDISHSNCAKALNVTSNGVVTKEVTKRHLGWAEVVDVSSFYGRSSELVTLKQWVIEDRCRLVTLLGMGGIGKTALAAALVTEMQHEFEFLIWRSLRNAPPVEYLLAELIQWLSNQKETEIPLNLDTQLSQLTHYLSASRCLLVLDNAESILQSGDHCGSYREGYEGYGQLLQKVGETRHQSCLLLTSREMPIGLAFKEGKNLPVRSLQLKGLSNQATRKILEVKGIVSSQTEAESLNRIYLGNPLAIKTVATTIQNIFDSNIAEFLSKETVVFGDIRNFLDQQFNRLSDTERQIMYWLAINQVPASLSELESEIVTHTSSASLIDALVSLERRSLIEKNAASFSLQPMLMEYVINQLIEQVCTEIATGEVTVLNSYALFKAPIQDYVKDAQVKLILQRVSAQLLKLFSNKAKLEHKISKILSELQDVSSLEPNYAAGNLLTLLYWLESNNRYKSKNVASVNSLTKAQKNRLLSLQAVAADC